MIRLSWSRRRRGNAMSLAGFLALAALSGMAYFASAERVTFTVRDKGRETVWDGRRHREVLLVRTDRGVFEVDSAWTFLVFDRWGRYEALRVGRTYEAIVAGWDVPLLDWRRNVVTLLAGS